MSKSPKNNCQCVYCTSNVMMGGCVFMPYILTTDIKESTERRVSKGNFARRNNTALGSWGQAGTSLKIEDLRSNKTTGKLS